MIIMSYCTAIKTLNGESLSRYKSKLNVINCKECPYKLPAGVFEKNTASGYNLKF
jgi:hypothetical protein